MYDTGQQDFGHYYGPSKPLFHLDRYQRKLIFQDDYFGEVYFNSVVNNELFSLQNYLDGEFTVGTYCPESELKKVEKYYTYLSRLLTISYLFESFREYEFASKLLGGGNSCEVDWAVEFKKCKPKTSEMKLFLRNLKHPLKGIKEIVVPFELGKLSGRKKWVKNFKQRQLASLAEYRLTEHCSRKNCRVNTPKDALKEFDRTCTEDRGLIQKLCSEEDRVYGVSYAPELYSLLLRSNVMGAVADKEFQAGCLRRFIEVYKNQEDVHPHLKRVYSYLYSYYMEAKIPHERGRLFPIGALKKFVDKGLANVFEQEPKRTLIKQHVNKQANLSKPKFEEITLPKFVEKKKKRKKKFKPKKVEKKKVRRSAFLTASLFRKKFALNRVAVDMDKFKYDYTFTLSQENDFNVIVHKFSSQRSLRDMHKYDKLGSKKAPIPLRFVKYLIDKDMHQGLYNIIFVLGDKFFIRNDIDKGVGEGIDFVSIKNDQSTQYQWKLEVLKNISNTKRPGKQKL